jgi:transcriptional regulator with XRE-family HTH domain
MDFKKQVGEALKKARQEKGLTMAQLAELMGKDRVTITRYESGKQNLSIETITDICKALNVSPELILNPTSK